MSSGYLCLIDRCDEIHFGESFFEGARSQLLEPKIVIVKGVIAPQVCKKVVTALLHCVSIDPENDPEVGTPNPETKNYHHRDVNLPRAQAKRIFHEF